MHSPVRSLLVTLALCLPLVASAQNSAPAGAQPFAPGVLDTEADEYGPTFSPDGRTVYFTLRADRRGHEAIVVSTWEDAGWTTPTTVSFSGANHDKEPFVTPDGSQLFFARNEVPGEGDTTFDIWVSERNGDGWSPPTRLGPAVNSGDYDNYPSVAANGNLYFGSRREGGLGRLDLYVSRFEDGQYLPAENLGPAINSESTDADPYIAPDESYLIFCSTRPGGAGSGDLYVSFRADDGTWGTPISLGDAVNGDDFDYTPLVTPDGSRLLFSRGWGEMFEISIAELPVDLYP